MTPLLLLAPIMALIVLTEPDPEEALKRLMKRCAYVVVPVSILWIKYYPELGRGFSPWGGGESRGIAAGKIEQDPSRNAA